MFLADDTNRLQLHPPKAGVDEDGGRRAPSIVTRGGRCVLTWINRPSAVQGVAARAPDYHRWMYAVYATLKMLHVGSAALSLGLFVVRGIWMMRSPVLLERRWVKIVPHAIDTVLLASAIALSVLVRSYPGADDWLTAKVAGLLLYIVLGSIALKRGRTRAQRIAAFLAAIAVFAYIVSVAVTKSAAGPLALLRP
jgi:uncharacterized membrane protein SirB2